MDSHDDDATHQMIFEDEIFGDLIWSLDAPLRFLRKGFVDDYLSMLTQSASLSGHPQSFTQDDVEEEADKATVEHIDLISKLAHKYFTEAKGNLLLEVAFSVMQNHQITIVDPDDGKQTVTSLREMLGSSFKKEINESRREVAGSLRQELKRLAGLQAKPGRPADEPLTVEAVKYFDLIYALIQEAKGKESSSEALLEPRFERLREHPELLALLGDHRPQELARIYLQREFGLPVMSDSALRAKLKAARAGNST